MPSRLRTKKKQLKNCGISGEGGIKKVFDQGLIDTMSDGLISLAGYPVMIPRVNSRESNG